MACSCNKKSKISAYESCVFCANKHVSACMATKDESARIGELMLASFHYHQDYPELESACMGIVKKIEEGAQVQAELLLLAERAWQLVTDNQDKINSREVENIPDDEIPPKRDIVSAHRAIAAASSLYNEIAYRDANQIFVIGQLVIAAWHLDINYHDLALQCRECWKKIEKLESCQKELNLLRQTVWQEANKNILVQNSNNS